MASPDAAILAEIARISGRSSIIRYPVLTSDLVLSFIQAQSIGQRQSATTTPTRLAIHQHQVVEAVILSEGAIHIINHRHMAVTEVLPIPIEEGVAILLSRTLPQAAIITEDHRHPIQTTEGAAEVNIITTSLQ